MSNGNVGTWVGSGVVSGVAVFMTWWNYALAWWWLALVAAVVFVLYWLGIMIIIWIDE